MPVPWLQIVQLVPSVVEVSRELMRRSRRMPGAPGERPPEATDLAGRIAALEENERRQAELVAQMAEQNAKLTQALMVLHRQLRWTWLGVATAIVVVLAAIALVR